MKKKKKLKHKKGNASKKNKMLSGEANDEAKSIHSDEYDPHGVIFPFMVRSLWNRIE